MNAPGSELARLVVPALRWDAKHGFGYLDGLIEDALELGAGGFLVEGGPRDDVAALTARLHAGSRHPILVAAAAGRGAGETLSGLTPLPPFGALGAVAVVRQEGTDVPGLDVEVVRRAARITARELRNAGVNWAIAPNCEVDVRGNPSGDAAGARTSGGIHAASDDPAVVGALVAEWIDACQAEAVVACGHAFAGDGRDPASLPRPAGAAIRAAAARNDPFAAAIDAGVASVMVTTRPVPALGGAGGAMRSARVVTDLLRAGLEFDGLIATAPLDREPSLARTTDAQVAVESVVAGCDAVLAPSDFAGAVEALERAAKDGILAQLRLRDALGRVERWAGWARPAAAREPTMDDILWTRQLADRAVRYVRGARPRVGGTLEVVPVGDAVDAALLEPLLDVFRSVHVDVTATRTPTKGERAPLAIVLVPAGAASGAVAAAESRAAESVARAGVAAGRDVIIVACCHPRGAAALTGTLAAEASVLCAWDASPPMLQAAARAIVTVR